MQHPGKGYRRIRDDLEHDFGMDVNDKRVLRICQAKKIKSAIKYSNHSCTHNASNPQYVAENVLKCDLRRWTKGYTIKQPNMDCQPTEITALMRHRAVFS